MAELNAIVAALRRSRQDIDDSLANASTRTGETADLIQRIETLQRRAEETQRTSKPKKD